MTALVTIEAWERGLKTLHFEQVIEPLNDADRATVEKFLEPWFSELVATIEARGYTPEAALERAAIMVSTEFARQAQDEAAYQRVCERKGLLPL